MTSAAASEGDHVLVLRPSPWKMVLLLLVSLGFVSIGIFLLKNGSSRADPVMAWLCMIFFGFCALIFLIQLIPGACYLRLAPDGFTVCSTWRKRYYRWDDIFEFGITTVPSGVVRRKIVGFNFSLGSTHPDRHSRTVGFSVAVCGYEAGLQDVYGLGCEKLADLMNQHLQQSRAQN